MTDVSKSLRTAAIVFSIAFICFAVLAVRGVTKRGCHGEDEAYFLVPAAEYDTRDRHGFVVDEARHERCAPVTGCASKTRNRGAESASEGAA